MATTARIEEEDEIELAIDLPSNREYADEADAELDQQLVETIAAAREVGNDYLATVLSHELGSHYYETR
jgi:hypothetical protein